MDGAGYLKIFFRISLPQLRPALASLGIITFTQTWNYYFQARVLLEPQDAMTLPIAMDVLRGYLGSGNLAVVMAAMSMSVLPVILLFLLAQKMVIEGIAMSGIKLRGAHGRCGPQGSRSQDRSPFSSIRGARRQHVAFPLGGMAPAACR